MEETIRNFEERDEQDPLLIVGVIRAVHGRQLESEQLTFIHNTLHDEFDVPADLMNLDETRWRVEVAPWVIEEISEQLKEMLVDIEGLEIGIAFEYPTWDRLQTMFNPL